MSDTYDAAVARSAEPCAEHQRGVVTAWERAVAILSVHGADVLAALREPLVAAYDAAAARPAEPQRWAWLCTDCGAVCELEGWPENGHHDRTNRTLGEGVHKGTCVRVRLVGGEVERD